MADTVGSLSTVFCPKLTTFFCLFVSRCPRALFCRGSGGWTCRRQQQDLVDVWGRLGPWRREVEATNMEVEWRSHGDQMEK